jgi:hypothetical protein
MVKAVVAGAAGGIGQVRAREYRRDLYPHIAAGTDLFSTAPLSAPQVLPTRN